MNASMMDESTIAINQHEPTRVGYHAPMWTPASDQLLSDWHYGMKRAMVMANQASERWNERSNWLNAYADSKGMSITTRMDLRSKDVWLKDAFGTWEFFQREVQRYGTMLAAEHAMRQMMSTEEVAR